MKQQHADSQVVPHPKIRRWMAAMFRSVQHKPMIHGLIEVDVTRARAHLREHQATTGESLSFTAFLMACLAQAVEEHKAVQAIRFGSKRLILFEEVDVLLPVEHDVAGQKHIMPSIIRAANRKTVREIHREIRAAQVQDVTKDLMRVQSLPTLLFQPYLWIFTWRGRRYPQVWKKNVGTVGITAVGMFGNGAGWGIPPAPPTTLMMTVGGIGQKPGVVDGTIAIRDYLSLTLSFNHEVIDGAPAARFTERLKELMESGYGLDDSTVESEQAADPRTSKQKVETFRPALPREQNESVFSVPPIPTPDASHVL
jgi:pyruvate/2-oxoglutarate dehydrogenase complex dihydrolipoamide acyltransferase (E2) component